MWSPDNPNHGTMKIRPYTDDDGPAVRSLFIRINREIAPETMRATFETFIARSLREEIDRIRAYFHERDGTFWVAECAGSLVGMYGVERVGRHTAELRRMYVAPESRRRGIARALLDHAERVCREAGYRRLVLSTSELQQPAFALYTAAGYRLLQGNTASAMTNKTIGGGVRRFHFQKVLSSNDR